MLGCMKIKTSLLTVHCSDVKEEEKRKLQEHIEILLQRGYICIAIGKEGMLFYRVEDHYRSLYNQKINKLIKCHEDIENHCH